MVACLILTMNSSCTSQIALNKKKEPSTKTMETLSVDDNFQYRPFKKVVFDFSIVNAEGVPSSKALFSFLGIDATGGEDVFYSGMTQQNGSVKIALDVPIHFEKVQIKVSKDKKTQNFDYPLDTSPSRQKLVFK